MRLICPTCSAAYEVDAGLIAPGGQHVQCTACHARWFARRPALAAPAEISEDDIIARLEARPRGPRAVTSAAPVATLSRPQPALRAVPAVPPQTGATFRWEDSAHHKAEGRTPEDRPHLRVVAPAETPPAESPAPPPTSTPPPVKQRPVVEAPAPSGRPRLDLEAAHPEAPPPPSAPQTGRFSRGLLVGLVLVIILIAGYRYADTMAERVPPAAPYLRSYVSAIDDGRVWLEARAAPLIESFRGAAPDG